MNDERIRITRSMEALSASRDNRSAIAQMREIWPDIQLALNAGVKQDAIWQQLTVLGYKITQRNFASAIQRIRKERNVQDAKASADVRDSAQPSARQLPTTTKGEKSQTPTEAELDFGSTARQQRAEKAHKYTSTMDDNLTRKLIEGDLK